MGLHNPLKWNAFISDNLLEPQSKKEMPIGASLEKPCAVRSKTAKLIVVVEKTIT